MICLLLLGAEGCAETEGEPYVRRATLKEHSQFLAEHPSVETVDHTGRPYWLVAVDVDHPDCPAEVKRTASGLIRVRRLIQ
jgi:hypothetical protein